MDVQRITLPSLQWHGWRAAESALGSGTIDTTSFAASILTERFAVPESGLIPQILLSGLGSSGDSAWLERATGAAIVPAHSASFLGWSSAVLRHLGSAAQATAMHVGYSDLARGTGWGPASGWDLFYDPEAVRDTLRQDVEVALERLRAQRAGPLGLDDPGALSVVRRTGGGFDCVGHRDRVEQSLQSLLSWTGRKPLTEIEARLSQGISWGYGLLRSTDKEQSWEMFLSTIEHSSCERDIRGWKVLAGTVKDFVRSCWPQGMHLDLLSHLVVAFPSPIGSAILAGEITQALEVSLQHVRMDEVSMGWNPSLSFLEFLGRDAGGGLMLVADGSGRTWVGLKWPLSQAK